MGQRLVGREIMIPGEVGCGGGEEERSIEKESLCLSFEEIPENAKVFVPKTSTNRTEKNWKKIPIKYIPPIYFFKAETVNFVAPAPLVQT